MKETVSESRAWYIRVVDYAFAHPLTVVVYLLAAMFPLATLVYSATHIINAPQYDIMGQSTPIALSAITGEWRPWDLFQPIHGVRKQVLTSLNTVVLTYLTSWNIAVEAWSNYLLTAVAFVGILFLIHRQYPAVVSIVVIPVSGLIWSIHQEFNWFITTHNFFALRLLLLVMALIILSFEKKNWRWFALVCLLSAIVTYQGISGFSIWFALLPAILFTGYHKLPYVFAWVLVGLLLTGAYFLFPPLDFEFSLTSYTGSPYTAEATMWNIGIYMLSVLGSLFSYEVNYYLAAAVGVVGIALLALNAAYLFTRNVQRYRSYVALWSSLSVSAIATGAMNGYGRISNGIEHSMLATWYSETSVRFWITIVILAGLTIYLVLQQKGTDNFGRITVASNVIVFIVLVPLYSYSLMDFWENRRSTSAVNMAETLENNRAYPLNREISGRVADHDRMALYGLGIYSSMGPAFEVEAAAEAGSPVVVLTDTPYVNAHIERWGLQSVDPDQIYHFAIFDDAHPADVDALPNVASFDDLAAELNTIAEQAIQTRSVSIVHETTGVSVDMMNSEVGSLLENMVLESKRAIDGTTIEVMSYVYFDSLPAEPVALYGPSIEMYGWHLGNDINVAPCQPVTVQTVWSARDALEVDYSSTLVLTDVNGNAIANEDGQPGELSTQLWLPTQQYVDERTLDIPCDIEPGEYLLLTGMYYYQDPANLPIRFPDGSDIGSLMYLTTLFVE